MKIRLLNLAFVLLFFGVALVAASCFPKNGGLGGPPVTETPSTPHLPPNPTGSRHAQWVLDAGMWVSVAIFLTGAVMAAIAAAVKRPPVLGLALAGAGVGTYVALALLAEYRWVIYLGAGIATVGLVAWEIVIHRKALAEQAKGNQPLPDGRSILPTSSPATSSN